MVTSSNGYIFRVTGPLCGEFTGHRWIPLTKASEAELWCFYIHCHLLIWTTFRLEGYMLFCRKSHTHYLLHVTATLLDREYLYLHMVHHARASKGSLRSDCEVHHFYIRGCQQCQVSDLIIYAWNQLHNTTYANNLRVVRQLMEWMGQDAIKTSHRVRVTWQSTHPPHATKFLGVSEVFPIS